MMKNANRSFAAIIAMILFFSLLPLHVLGEDTAATQPTAEVPATAMPQATPPEQTHAPLPSEEPENTPQGIPEQLPTPDGSVSLDEPTVSPAPTNTETPTPSPQPDTSIVPELMVEPLRNATVDEADCAAFFVMVQQIGVGELSYEWQMLNEAALAAQAEQQHPGEPATDTEREAAWVCVGTGSAYTVLAASTLPNANDLRWRCRLYLDGVLYYTTNEACIVFTPQDETPLQDLGLANTTGDLTQTTFHSMFLSFLDGITNATDFQVAPPHYSCKSSYWWTNACWLVDPTEPDSFRLPSSLTIEQLSGNTDFIHLFEVDPDMYSFALMDMPSSAGTATFRVTASDSRCYAQYDFTLKVSANTGKLPTVKELSDPTAILNYQNNLQDYGVLSSIYQPSYSIYCPYCDEWVYSHLATQHPQNANNNYSFELRSSGYNGGYEYFVPYTDDVVFKCKVEAGVMLNSILSVDYTFDIRIVDEGYDPPAPSPSTLTLVPNDSVVIAGSSVTIPYKLTQGKKKKAEWSVSGSSYATISSSGKLTINKKLFYPVDLTVELRMQLTNGESHVAQCSIQAFPAPTSLSLNATNLYLEYDKTKPAPTFTLSPSVLPSRAPQDVIYASSNPKVATVSSDGIVTAVGSGSASITMKSKYKPSIKKSIVAVVFIPVNSVSISPDVQGQCELIQGKSMQFRASLSPAKPSVTRVTWRVTNESGEVDPYASINSKGKLTFKANAPMGAKYYVTATSGFGTNGTDVLSNTYCVTVCAKAASVMMSPGSAKLYNKDGFDFQQLSATAVAKNVGDTVAGRFSYKLDKKGQQFLSVDTNGLVRIAKMPTAVTKAIVTATLLDGSGLSAKTAITLVPTPVTGLEIHTYDKETDLIAGQSIRLFASFTPTTASEQQLEWSFTVDGVQEKSPSQYAKISSGKKVMLTIDKKCPVPATLCLSAKALGALPGSEVVATYTVNVLPAVEKIEIETNKSLYVGQSTRLWVSVNPENADRRLTWTTSNPKVVTISQDGTITAVSGGTATVTATSMDNSKKKATCKVIVAIPVSAIMITPAKGGAYAPIGKGNAFTATLFPKNATYNTVNWSIDKPEYATITQKGVLTLSDQCPVNEVITISATNICPTGMSCTTATLAVTAKQILQSLTVESPLTHKVDELATLQLNISLTPENAMPLAWSSNNPKVATVDQNGLVTPVQWSKKPVTITAQSIDGTSKKVYFNVTVTEHIYDPIESFKLSRSEVYMSTGDTYPLTGTITPAGANQKISWSSKNKSVVSIDNNGVLTAHKKGTATIVATATNADKTKLEIECTVNVGTYQPAIVPLKNLLISQGPNGTYSHYGYFAIDFLNTDERAVAPFDCTIINISDKSNNVYVQSDKPVAFADGTKDYMTVLFMHDDNVSDLKVGQKLAQGTEFYDAGTAGLNNNNPGSRHIHLECARGKFAGTKYCYQNSAGYKGDALALINGLSPDKALYIQKGTVIGDTIYDIYLDWVTAP